MTNSYGAPLAQPSAGDQRNRLAALLMERQMGGPIGAPQPGVPTPSAAQPMSGQAPGAPTQQSPGAPAMPGAGAMPPPMPGQMPGQAPPPLPGVTPGGGQPGQPLPLRY